MTPGPGRLPERARSIARRAGAGLAGAGSVVSRVLPFGRGPRAGRDLRIVLDCRYVRIGRHDGISRYTASIVAELAGLVREEGGVTLTMIISDRRQLAHLPDLPWELVSSPTSPLEPFVALRVNRLRPDVVFTPMQTMGSLGRRYALVLTVHDLIYYRHRTPPRDLPQAVRILWRLYHLAWWPQRLLLSAADTVVTVSETTEALILDKELASAPVVVVSNAADEPGRAASELAAARPNGAGARVLVYMGSYMPYKNVETLVRGMRLLHDYELHLVSRVSDAEKDRLRALAPSAHLVFSDGASDEEYHALLARATALVTASKDEGFGIPLVEAMALGTPVVVSDIPIFREIGGPAATLFDPRSAQEFAAAVRGLEDPARWAEQSRRSRVRAGRYRWQVSARVLLDTLRALGRERRESSGR